MKLLVLILLLGLTLVGKKRRPGTVNRGSNTGNNCAAGAKCEQRRVVGGSHEWNGFKEPAQPYVNVGHEEIVIKLPSAGEMRVAMHADSAKEGAASARERVGDVFENFLDEIEYWLDE